MPKYQKGSIPASKSCGSFEADCLWIWKLEGAGEEGEMLTFSPCSLCFPAPLLLL
jgi:hypothetical protein